MTDLAKLREEHAQLVTIVTRLGHVIARPAAPPQVDLYSLRRELSSTLVAHLKAEDWVLYPRLMESKDPAVADTARAFSDEMGGLAAAYSAYAETWNATAIEADWPGYCAASKGIVDALTCRIARENRELYPLLEALDKAA
jgi:iron-sulfur cluster repair protein YtfE (RIC family)